MKRTLPLVGLLLSLIWTPTALSAPPADGPRGTYLGQDGHDYCRGGNQLGPDDIQDLHLRLDGLPAADPIASATFTRQGAGMWSYAPGDAPTPHWRAALRREAGSASADVFLDPSHDDASFEVTVELAYRSGKTDRFDVHCGRSDRNLFMPAAVLRPTWVGQDGHDLTGPTPAPGPDGLVDARIDLAGLSTRVELESIRLETEGGQAWEYGPDLRRYPRAERVPEPKDPTRAALYFSPRGDLHGRKLRLTAAYANGRGQTVEVAAGPTDPRRAVPLPHEVELAADALSAQWLGQDRDDAVVAQNPANRGEVRVEVSGLPRDVAILAAALSDTVGGFWIFRGPAAPASFYVPAPGDGVFDPLPLTVERTSNNPAAVLHFPPFRDETGTKMTLRLLLRPKNATGETADRTAVCTFAAGACDPYRRGPVPADVETTARPGDDLSDLAARFGHVRLSPGVYKMTRPLSLDRPVVLSGTPESVLEFSQPANDAPWKEAIRLRASNITLDGFSVRFAGSVRWDTEGPGGAAILRAAEPLANAKGWRDPLTGLALSHLHIDSSPAAKLPPEADPREPEHAPYLLRTGPAASGRIVGNTFRGGTVEVYHGPWQIADNVYRGTSPGTVAWDAFAAHEAHDLLLEHNLVRPESPCGKTWRFLTLTQRGERTVVRDNTVANIGIQDGDVIPNPNAPEIVLTESYHLNFEGKPARVSAAGRVLQLPQVQDGRIGPGNVVSVLSGPLAGRYFRVAQPLSPTDLLMEEPLPKELWACDEAISVAHGFTDGAWERNTIDNRGGRSLLVVLAGNHWNMRLANNRLSGGGEAMRIEAAPTESPGRWGWSRSPLLDLALADNETTDSLRGVSLDVPSGPPASPVAGRTYLTAALHGNTFRRTDKFAGAAGTPAIRIGSRSGPDAGQMRLTLDGNRGEVPDGTPPLVIHVAHATVNSRQVEDETTPLTPAPAKAAEKAEK